MCCGRTGMRRLRTGCLLWAAVVAAAVRVAVPGAAPVCGVAFVAALAAPTVYRYFGYGSNVIPSTMKALRQIEVREVTAAVLPGYELRFESAAFVRPLPDPPAGDRGERSSDKASENDDPNRGATGPAVHGLLYTLTEDEFAMVGSTEGVPFGYRWQSCFVYPYRGNGKRAGQDAVIDPGVEPIRAYTLVESRVPASGRQEPRQTQQRRSISNDGRPPSASYLGLIREGARLWKFDRTYQDELATVSVAKSRNVLVPDGWEGPALELAEKATGTKRTYMIDGY
ncbi:unnamed protein product [Pseudo-nitzschia multistriata]|uniref:gamma-glutamylcyclotransferase n=1 Tax=Pseudo-nitzschia multistriata TaxID=183589 RepID=A0A448Z605_9STRA|nr:unnamed protein product [Pseudo-nitzschia multistriata]